MCPWALNPVRVFRLPIQTGGNYIIRTHMKVKILLAELQNQAPRKLGLGKGEEEVSAFHVTDLCLSVHTTHVLNEARFCRGKIREQDLLNYIAISTQKGKWIN